MSEFKICKSCGKPLVAGTITESASCSCVILPCDNRWPATEIQRRIVKAMEEKEKHKTTSFHEFPHTCGGCHFWSGYIAALQDFLSGKETTK